MAFGHTDTLIHSQIQIHVVNIYCVDRRKFPFNIFHISLYNNYYNLISSNMKVNTINTPCIRIRLDFGGFPIACSRSVEH